MNILYFANGNSIHTARWIQYFVAKNHYCILWPGPPFVKGPDIIHAHYAGKHGLYGALYKLTKPHCPFILTVWGSDIIINQNIWYKRPLLKWMLSKADIITTDGYHMIPHLTALDVEKNKIHKINFGVDTRYFSPDPKLKTKHPSVAVIRFHDRDTTWRAERLVKEKYPDCTFYCAQGNQPPGVIRAMLQQSWVYLDASPTDAGLAQSTAEAMACGLPVVITKFGDNQNWAAGFHQAFKIGNHKELADKVCYLLSDKGTRNSIGNKNRQAIIERNDVQKEMSKMEAIYTRLQKSK